MRSVFAPLLLAALAIAGDRTSAQANVTENQSTDIYVDARLGSDNNSGAHSSAFKTLQAAVKKANLLNQQSTGVKVTVNAGVYREFVNAGNSNSSSAPLTLQAAAAGTAIIAGSDVLTGWSNSGGIYTRGWAYAQSACAAPAGWPSPLAPIALRTEMIFVNGTPLTQVLSWSDMTPGTFFINNAYAVIHINPPTGTDMSTAVVEGAVRPQTFSLLGRTQFASTLTATNNTWYDPATVNSFKVVNYHIVALSNWQSTVQTNYSSVWKLPAASPVTACAAPAPTYADFNVNLDSSNYTMAAGKAVATIESTPLAVQFQKHRGCPGRSNHALRNQRVACIAQRSI
jgi:hypothetical protein